MKKIISYCVLLILIPAVVVGGALLFRDRQYAWVSLCVTLLSCVPVFLHFERSGADAKRMVLRSHVSPCRGWPTLIPRSSHQQLFLQDRLKQRICSDLIPLYPMYYIQCIISNEQAYYQTITHWLSLAEPVYCRNYFDGVAVHTDCLRRVKCNQCQLLTLEIFGTDKQAV